MGTTHYFSHPDVIIMQSAIASSRMFLSFRDTVLLTSSVGFAHCIVRGEIDSPLSRRLALAPIIPSSNITPPS